MSKNSATLGARIRQARKAQQLTQEVVAERVGIDPKSLSGIENNKFRPSVDTLEALAEAMGVSIHSFFKQDAPNDAAPTTLKVVRGHLHEFIHTADETTLMRWYRESLKDDTPR
jgi:transcriptional regulator with XRE-family HTH domain